MTNLVTNNVFNRVANVPLYTTVPDTIRRQYGQALQYPWAINNNRWDTVLAEDRVRVSMYIVLTTPVGTRFNRPDFGSLLPHIIGNPFTPKLRQELKLYTSQAISKWITEIDIGQVFLDESNADNNQIGILIPFRLKGILTDYTFVLPVSLQSNQPFSASGSFTVGGRQVFSI